MQIVDQAKLIQTQTYGYKSGVAGQIVGVCWVIPEPSLSPCLCYCVMYSDGSIDYVAISDIDNYKVI